MRKLTLIGASALVLALGAVTASAQPSGQSFMTRGNAGVASTRGATVYEGRAAAIEAPAADAFVWQQHHGR